MSLLCNKDDENFSVVLYTGVTCGAGTLLSQNSTGYGVLATANSGTSTPARGMAITSGTSGDRITLWRHGKVSMSSGLTTGATYYNDGAGGMTSTRPTIAGALIQTVGFAIAEDTFVLNIDDSYVVKAANL
jgi:hypothetical protein